MIGYAVFLPCESSDNFVFILFVSIKRALFDEEGTPFHR